MYKRARQHGIALVLVLWMLALFTVLAAGYRAGTRTETLLTAHLVQTARARALAEAGIWRATAELLKPVQEQAWKTDGSSYTVDFADGKINLCIQDAAGKIDLNSARSELLHSLLRSLDVELGEAERIALLHAILDWVDRDNLVRQYGAEDDDYKNAGLDYGAKDGPFNSLDELQRVLGMTPAIVQKMKPALTIHSHQPGIVAEVAPRAVLLALPGITAETVDHYVSQHRNTQIPASGPIAGIDPRYLSKVRGKTFAITSQGQVAGSQAHIEAVIMINRNSNPLYSVLSWQENNRQSSDADATPDS